MNTVIAKNFKAQTHTGKIISLDDYQGKKVWLAFFRYASCPLCNLQIQQIIKRHQEVLDKGIVFIPVFQSTIEIVRKYVVRGDIPFEIICDPEEKLYKQYQVSHSYMGFLSFKVIFRFIQAIFKGLVKLGNMDGEKSRLPSDFLIDEEQNIIFRFDAKDISEHLEVDQLLLQLAKD